ncbi:hypothetical protein WAI453_007010 [Rhynchosporium graminicola]
MSQKVIFLESATSTAYHSKEIGFKKLCLLQLSLYRPQSFDYSHHLCTSSMYNDDRKISVLLDQGFPTRNYFFGTKIMEEKHTFKYSKARKGKFEEE